MTTIVTRAGLGSPLPSATVDANFTNLNTDKLELGGTFSSGTANSILYLNGSKVLTTGSALTFDGTKLSLPTVLAIKGAQNSNLARIVMTRTDASYSINNETDLRFYGQTTDTESPANILHSMNTGGTFVWNNGSGSEQMRLTSTGLTVEQGAVFNESGADSDFRVESDTVTHMLLVDASENKVAIGSSAVYTRLTVSNGNSARTGITLTDANTASLMLFAGNSANAVLAADGARGINFQTGANVGQENGTVRASIGIVGGPAWSTFGSARLSDSTNIDPDDYANTVVAGNVADGGGFGGLGIGIRQGGAGQTGAIVVSNGGMYFGIGDNSTANSITGMLDINRSAIVFNENGLDTDFRVESDGNTHCLFVDAGNNKVAINGSAVQAGASLNVFNGGILNYTEYALSGTSPVDLGATMTGGVYVIRDNLNGGTCIVLYENGGTPIIVSQSGSNYTTGTPTGTQVKLAQNGASGIAASMASGQSTTLRVMALICDPD